ncbi:MAG: NADP-dependent malic enzyme, partial [Bacteroidales bacterium]|nr:NADP-dependent malic enzyme [Bacteroidales bacterium]
MTKITKEDALNYHSEGRPGKIEVIPTKPHSTQWDLSVAYSPGVAEPCLEIEKNPEDAFKYTAKGNLVAVISNGTAVLGLGNIGALAGKPVMEGKGLLFKIFADVDVFDIEIDATDVDKFIEHVKAISPTFGGINLEDIKAPECFEIEQRLIEELDIPVFHDDQHGTAIISGSGLLNALELNEKKIKDLKVVVNGAGASAISCTRLYVSLGVKKENVIMLDSKGVLSKKRTDLNKYKLEFAIETDISTLADALKGADVFLGLSKADVMTPEMLKTMAPDPIVFAMANPNPEISYDKAMSARNDLIFATGRSDYPNQINNVLGFPFIFRGALDVRATDINEAMKHAATKALAELAKEDVPDSVCKAYGVERLTFGREYLIPKPFDHRVLLREALAVARAAMETGVAKINLDLDEYEKQLEARLGRSRSVMRGVISKAQRHPKRVVFPEGEDTRILRACMIILDEGIAHPILLGNPEVIKERMEELGMDLENVEIIDPRDSAHFDEYAEKYFELRQRKGRTLQNCRKLMRLPRVYGPMMVHMGDADSVLGGVTMHYPEMIRPEIRVIGLDEATDVGAGIHMLVFDDRVIFFADTTVNIDPSAKELASIARFTAKYVRGLGFEPRVAMLS